MPQFGSTGAAGGAPSGKLNEDERDRVAQRLDRLTSDPIRTEFGDPDLFAFADRQRDRLTDDAGVPVRKRFEAFQPTVRRSDTLLESPVGGDEPNHPRAVFNTKKLLNAAGFHGFRPGIEQMGEASPRFLADLERFQASHDLKIDGTVHPGGPTLHMLTKSAFGPEEGPPSFAEAELFEHRFGRDPNVTLSGEPIFGGAGDAEALGEAVRTPTGVDSLVPVEFPLEPGSRLPVEKERPVAKGRARLPVGTRQPTNPVAAFSPDASKSAAERGELSPDELRYVTNALQRGSPYQRPGSRLFAAHRPFESCHAEKAPRTDTGSCQRRGVDLGTNRAL